MVDIKKLRDAFPDTTVFKDPNIVAIFMAASIPAFLRDWILKRKAESDGKIHDPEALRRYIYDIIPRREDLLTLQGDARRDGASKKFLAKVEIQFNVGSNKCTFAIPELGLPHKDTVIEDYVWDRIKEDVEKTAGGWGLVQLGYRPPDDEHKKGALTLLEYKNFCPYTINLDSFREARRHFSVEEWIDIVLGAIVTMVGIVVTLIMTLIMTMAVTFYLSLYFIWQRFHQLIHSFTDKLFFFRGPCFLCF